MNEKTFKKRGNMKLIIGLILLGVGIYVLVDLDIINSSDFATVRDYVKEKGSQAWNWLIWLKL